MSGQSVLNAADGWPSAGFRGMPADRELRDVIEKFARCGTCGGRPEGRAAVNNDDIVVVTYRCFHGGKVPHYHAIEWLDMRLLRDLELVPESAWEMIVRPFPPPFVRRGAVSAEARREARQRRRVTR